MDKGTPAQAPPPEETESTPTSLIVAPDADRGVTTPTSVATQLPIATEQSQSSSSSSNSNSNDASAGAKAGIAIGVIAGVLVLAGLIFFLIRRKKKKGERQSLEDDEKLHGAFSSANYTPTAAAAVTAAAVASSPVTHGNYNEKPVAGGAAAGAAPFNRGQNEQPRSPGVSGWERPMTSQSQSSANPFGPQAELPGSMPPSPSSGAPIAAAAVAGAAAGATAVRGMQRQTSRNHGHGHGPKPLDLTLGPPAPLQGVPPSPVGTEYSVSSISPGQQFPASSSAAAIAAAGGPAGSMVHRVQLDFKPTLEDELELKAGQLVRLLHEYDDGWVSWISPPPSYFYDTTYQSRDRRKNLTAIHRLSAFDWIGPVKV